MSEETTVIEKFEKLDEDNRRPRKAKNISERSLHYPKVVSPTWPRVDYHPSEHKDLQNWSIMEFRSGNYYDFCSIKQEAGAVMFGRVVSLLNQSNSEWVVVGEDNEEINAIVNANPWLSTLTAENTGNVFRGASNIGDPTSFYLLYAYLPSGKLTNIPRTVVESSHRIVYPIIAKGLMHREDVPVLAIGRSYLTEGSERNQILAIDDSGSTFII